MIETFFSNDCFVPIKQKIKESFVEVKKYSNNNSNIILLILIGIVLYLLLNKTSFSLCQK